MRNPLATVAILLLTATTLSAVTNVTDTALNIAVAPYKRVQEEFLQINRELAECLKAVENKETADAAVETVKALAQRLVELRKKEAKLPKAPPYIAKLIQKKKDHSELCEQSVGRALDLTTAEEPPCYGSAALQKALDELLTAMAGGGN